MLCPPAPMPTFTLTLGATVLPFEKTEVRFGRTSDNDVVVADALASRSHARIYKSSDRWYVEDLQSGNGTKRNGAKIAAPVELKSGDTVAIGDTVYTFTLPNAPLMMDSTQPVPELPALDANATMLKPPPNFAISQPIDGEATRPPADKTALQQPSDDSTVLKAPKVDDSTVPRNMQAMQPAEDPNATILKPPPELRDALAKKSEAKVVDADTRDVAPALSAADKRREKREAEKKGAAGRLAYNWKQLSPGARKGISIGAGVFGLAIVAGSVALLMPKPKAELPPEPNDLTAGAAPAEASYGLGDGVMYPRRDQKVFQFTAVGATRLIGVVHYQAKEITKDEVSITLNGTELGFVPPDTLDTERELEVVLPAAQLKRGEPNTLVFDNVKNPPGDETWRVANVWLEIVALPDLSQEEMLVTVNEDMLRAQTAWEQREIGPENRFRAWKGYREAWLKLEAMPSGRPEALYTESRLRLREVAAELDAKCSTMQLEVVKMMQAKRPDYELARSTLQQALLYFPTREHRCHAITRELLEQIGGPL